MTIKFLAKKHQQGLISDNEALNILTWAYYASQDKKSFRSKLALAMIAGAFNPNICWDMSRGRHRIPPRRPQDDFLAGFDEEVRIGIKERMEKRTDKLLNLI